VSDDQISDEEFFEHITPDDWYDIAKAFGIPWPLVKAAFDPFYYAVGLRDGTVIHFTNCAFDSMLRAQPVFVTLRGIESHNIPAQEGDSQGRPCKFNFERGLMVRLDHIVWAADAPYGS
jgi:hypothetical protein